MTTKLTKGCKESGDGGAVLVTNHLVLAENVVAHTLDNARLGITLIFQLSQAEGEGAKLLDNFRKDLSGGGTLQLVSLGGSAVESCTVVQGLDLSRAQAHTDLDAPDLAHFGDTVALGSLGGGKNNLLGSFDLVAGKQPRSGALDQLGVVGFAHLLQQAADLGLGGGLLGGGLGLLFVGTLGEETRGDHQAEEKLISVVGGEDQVSVASGNRLSSLVLGGGEDSVADNGTKSVNLSSELDLNGLSLLDLG